MRDLRELLMKQDALDFRTYTPEFKRRHSSAYRLTDVGIDQAKVAGQWIRENIGDRFDRYYTSEFVR